MALRMSPTVHVIKGPMHDPNINILQAEGEHAALGCIRWHWIPRHVDAIGLCSHSRSLHVLGQFTLPASKPYMHEGFLGGVRLTS